MVAEATYELHPITGKYADFTKDERKKMRASLKAIGQQQPIYTWQGRIVDGRHRDDILRELEIEPNYEDFGDIPEEEMKAKVEALNEHRRANVTPLTRAEQKANVQRIEEALLADPERSDRSIALSLDPPTSHTTVARVRSALEASGKLATSEEESDGAEENHDEATAQDAQEEGKPAKRKAKKSAAAKKAKSQRVDKRGRVGGGQTHKAAKSKPKPTAAKKARQPVEAGKLNSLAWTNANAEQRSKFVDAVGLVALIKAAGDDNRVRALISLFKTAPAAIKEEFDEWLRTKSGFYKPDAEDEQNGADAVAAE